MKVRRRTYVHTGKATECISQILHGSYSVATLACLGAGLRAFHKGQAATSQRLMRGRVLAQGFTVVVMLAGAAYGFKPGGERPKTYGEKMRLEQEQREREMAARRE